MGLCDSAGAGEDRRVLSKSQQYRRLLKMYGGGADHQQPLTVDAGEKARAEGGAANDGCQMCQFVVQYAKIALTNNETIAQVSGGAASRVQRFPCPPRGFFAPKGEATSVPGIPSASAMTQTPPPRMPNQVASLHTSSSMRCNADPAQPGPGLRVLLLRLWGRVGWGRLEQGPNWRRSPLWDSAASLHCRACCL